MNVGCGSAAEFTGHSLLAALAGRQLLLASRLDGALGAANPCNQRAVLVAFEKSGSSEFNPAITS